MKLSKLIRRTNEIQPKAPRKLSDEECREVSGGYGYTMYYSFAGNDLDYRPSSSNNDSKP